MEPRKITRKQIAECNKNILEKVFPFFECFKGKKKLSFDRRLAGSASKNLTVSDKEGKFDLDYQIILNTNKCSYTDANRIKNEFFYVLSDSKRFGKVENSTTAITVKGFKYKDLTYSIDIVFIGNIDGVDQIIKRDLNPNNKDTNHYSWAKMPTRYNGAYDKLKKLSSKDKIKLCEFIRDSKIKEKNHPSNPPLAGFEVFLRCINEYKR